MIEGNMGGCNVLNMYSIIWCDLWKWIYMSFYVMKYGKREVKFILFENFFFGGWFDLYVYGWIWNNI